MPIIISSSYKLQTQISNTNRMNPVNGTLERLRGKQALSNEDITVFQWWVGFEETAKTFVCEKPICKLWEIEKGKKRTSRIVVDVLEMLQLPRGLCCSFIFPSLALLILRPPAKMKKQKLVSSKHTHLEQSNRTSIRLFSLLAISKSPSLIPFATGAQSFLLSHSPCSSTGLTVTSSFGGFTSWNVTPFAVFEVVCHVPSIISVLWEDVGGLIVALKEWDLPEK